MALLPVKHFLVKKKSSPVAQMRRSKCIGSTKGAILARNVVLGGKCTTSRIEKLRKKNLENPYIRILWQFQFVLREVFGVESLVPNQPPERFDQAPPEGRSDDGPFVAMSGELV